MQKCRTEAEGKKEAPGRSRWHEVILYPEDGDAANVQALAAAAWPEWVSILHDLDTNPETGELKSPHIHLLLHSANAKSISAVAKALRVPAHMVEAVSNGEAALAYLTHSTDRARLEGKHQYPKEALRGPLAQQAAEAAERALGTASEGAQVVAILDHISSTPARDVLSMAELARWAAASGLWASFRRAAIIFKTVMEEHNAIAYSLRVDAEAAARPETDPLRFSRLRAGEIVEPAAKVDMQALEAVGQ